jgi:hypothetical protein
VDASLRLQDHGSPGVDRDASGKLSGTDGAARLVDLGSVGGVERVNVPLGPCGPSICGPLSRADGGLSRRGWSR